MNKHVVMATLMHRAGKCRVPMSHSTRDRWEVSVLKLVPVLSELTAPSGTWSKALNHKHKTRFFTSEAAGGKQGRRFLFLLVAETHIRSINSSSQ